MSPTALKKPLHYVCIFSVISVYPWKNASGWHVKAVVRLSAERVVLGCTGWRRFGALRESTCLLQPLNPKWEFPKIRGTLFWGPYNKDPTI